MNIQRTGYDGKMFELVDEKTGEPVETDTTVTDFRGETGVLFDGQAPHKPSSNGKVYVNKTSTSYAFAAGSYASVYGLKWVEVE